MRRLLLFFIVLPLIELYLLIKIGGVIGAFNTVLLVVLAAILGLALARMEGLRTWRQINDNLAHGVVPAEELVDAFLIFTGGVLLLTPGVLTDLLALVLLVPVTRTWFKRWLRRKFDRMRASGRVAVYFPRDRF